MNHQGPDPKSPTRDDTDINPSRITKDSQTTYRGIYFMNFSKCRMLYVQFGSSF